MIVKTTHTPGPWAIVPSSNPKNGSAWCDIVSMGGEFSPAYVGEALDRDAFLIAAAPDLLAALMMVLDDPEALDGRPRTAEFVRKAIAKATGESKMIAQVNELL